MAAARGVFLFLLPGQYGFRHVAGLVHVRQINLGLNSLRRS
jgi:hypothetical protein